MSGPEPLALADRLARARLWAASRFPYLASALFALEVAARPGLGGAVVDETWNLYVDPEVAGSWTAEQLGSLLVHHVGHLLRDHAARARVCGVGPAQARRWIRATDAEINDDLVDAGLDQPGEVVLPADLGAPPGRFAEEYFGTGARDDAEGSTAPERSAEPGSHDPSPRAPSPGHEPPSQPGSDGNGDRSGPRAEDHPAEQGDRPAEPGDHRPEPGDQQTEPGCGSGADGLNRPWDRAESGPIGPSSAQLLRWQAAQEIRAAAQARRVPAGWRRWAERLGHPQANWRQVLAAEIRVSAGRQAGMVDYSYARPSRRASVSPTVVLPSLRAPVPHVAVVCDTSASVTDRMLGRALGEVAGIVAAIGVSWCGVTVLSCDAAVGTVQRVARPDRIELLGGGGTDMRAGLERAAALPSRPDVVVVLTDGLTPWPDEPPARIPVVVGLLGAAAVQAPHWARSVRIVEPGERM